ncbi:amino acid adenylation domain-containing protein [Kitasatospora viridis]|uniref:Amino acid adenylation domain-containing protein n=1 Tax=Kitasatospora viridis TaxID=281105 RepID=A0A561UIN2_9ACTN|nr:amino acid adenylation domain-containing protein [Kitasatospora viridis]TWF99238.1 amino acid adenylation domain-containing protein [Kitasatospora viridis]
MTTPTIDELAAGCHSLVLRLPGAADPQHLLSGAMPGPVRVWQTPVPAGADEPLARDRRRAESLRPIHQDGPPLRAVALNYLDGTTDLVLVAVRAVIPPAALRRIARLLLDGSGDSLPAWPTATRPGLAHRGRLDWGLGDPRLHGVVGSARIDLTALGGRAEQLLVPAIALAVSRYGGGDRTELGVLDLSDGTGEHLGAHPLDEHPQGSIADFLRRFDQAPVAPHEPPPVGVVLSPAFEEGSYTACLAPVLPLTIQLDRGSSRADCRFDQGIVDASIARQFCAHVAHLAEQLANSAAQRPLSELELLPHTERAAVLRVGGAGDAAPVRGRIDRAFEEMAAKQPQAVALLAGEEQLTYRQLDERADAVAAGLRALDVAPGSRIGVCLERDAELVVTLLGVLKADCAYVPMDPRYPEQRLGFTARNAGMPVIITSAPNFPAVPGTRLLTPGELTRLAADPTPAGARADEGGEDPAYVIYTSGSTGTPKGVVVPHRNVLALLQATTGDLALGPDDTWTLFHSSAFDFSVWEIWGCLLTGGRLVVVPYWTTRDTEEFYTLLAEQRVTVLNQTPSAFAQLIRTDQHVRRDLALRLVVFGGEPLDVRMLAPWFTRHPATDCRVVNMFGITETTVHVTAQTVTPHEVVTGSRSVGRALPGWSVSIRDAQGRVLPPGPAGEIYVGGAGVAGEYLGQPELTGQRFILDEATGERIYRSGDKGRLHLDGRLDHLGRLDNQVKIRGHRIELDEIRTVLLGAPQVTAAAVVVNRDQPDDPASSRIDAYVVLEAAGDRALVLAHAKAMLPDYMTPATLTQVTGIPLTINGKPDTAQLPDPRTAPADDPIDTPEPATSSIADTVLRIWSKQLNTPVSLQDNFFTLGGNSLLVVRVLAEMRAQNLPKISPKQFYSHSTAAQFTEFVQQLTEANQ